MPYGCSERQTMTRNERKGSRDGLPFLKFPGPVELDGCRCTLLEFREAVGQQFFKVDER